MGTTSANTLFSLHSLMSLLFPTKVTNEQCFTTDVRTMLYEAYSWGFRKLNQLHRATGATSAKTLFHLVYTQSRFSLRPNQSHNNVTWLQFLQFLL